MASCMARDRGIPAPDARRAAAAALRAARFPRSRAEEGDEADRRAPARPHACRSGRRATGTCSARAWCAIGMQEPDRAPAHGAAPRARPRKARRRAPSRAGDRGIAQAAGLPAARLALGQRRAVEGQRARRGRRLARGCSRQRRSDGCTRKALAQAQDIDWRDAEQRHRLRIRMKRLRYACDFFAASFAGAAARPYIKRLAALQDILGDLNDIAVARRLLAEIAPRGSAPEHCGRRRRTRAIRSPCASACSSFRSRPPGPRSRSAGRSGRHER